MGRLWGWTVAIFGKVVSATKDEVIIVSSDKRSGSISLRLDAEDLLIRHAEPHEIPIHACERDSTLASLMFALPLRIRPADLKQRLLEAPPRERLFVMEMPRDAAANSSPPKLGGEPSASEAGGSPRKVLQD
jgi:hypothetical protein